MSVQCTRPSGIERGLVGVSVLLAGWWGCSQSPPTASSPTTAGKPAGESTMEMTISTTAFDAGAKIPAKYTGEGPDVSPALTWSGTPQGTVEFALIMDDPDAPRPEPWVHWVICKIPADARGLPEGVPREPKLREPAGAIQGKNSWPSDNIGYRGPMPPPGHGTHHYHFRLYALDAALSVSPGLSKSDLLEAMRGHILAEAEVMGTYQR